MKSYYTIGETAALLGVTTQTLRYYDKVGLLSPGHVDPTTGYRYYSFTQFHYIDRIKYLQSFGMNLEEIRQIIQAGTVDRLLPFLERQKHKQELELERIRNTISDIQWYMDYFRFMDRAQHQDQLYKVQLAARYVLAVPCYPETDIPISKMEIRLAGVKAQPQFKGLAFLRQYAYLVDFAHLVDKEFWPSHYFIYLRDKPDFESENLMELPGGEYLCYRARMLTDAWDAEPLREFFRHGPQPRLVIANEFEENLVEYLDTQYEIQMLLA